jgi:O-antigen/teichoic acid export membrane protein
VDFLNAFNIQREGHPKHQLPLNLAGNLAYFFVNLIIGLLLVPYFLSSLGVAAYGIIPLATSLNGYVGLLTQSLNTAVSRYLTVDLKRGDYTSANKTFNSAFFGISFIILCITPFVVLLSLLTPVLFNMPPGQESGAILLFLGVNGAFLIRSWTGNFTVSLFAYNRLDLLNLVNITNVVVQVVLIVLFFSISTPSLALVGLAYLIGGVSASILAIFLSRKINPHLKIDIHDFDKSKIKEIFSTGSWVIVIQVGSVLFNQLDLIVVNILFGATSGGEYAIALQWVVLLRAISGTLSGVLTPVILTYYARDNIDMIIKISQSSVKIMGLFMALPIGLVCGCAPQLLTLWVGSQYVFLAPLMILLTCHLAINTAILPLFSINIALNKVKIPGILTLIMGLFNFFFEFTLPVLTGWGMYGVAVAGAITLTAKNALFTPWYASHILNIPSKTFVKSMIPGLIGMPGIALASAGLLVILHGSLLITLFIVGILISSIYVALIWLFGLNTFERTFISSYFPKQIRRFIE